MAANHYDVAVVGYGPVGAACALLLAEAGLRVAVIERDLEICDLPRAVGLDGESVRMFQRIGMADEISAILHAPREVERVEFTNSKFETLFGLDIEQHGVSGWRDTAFFDQPELEAVIRGAIGKRDRVDVRLGHLVESIEQNEDRVGIRGRVLATDEPFEIQADYLIGSDGASSFVRESCGIAWNSLGYDQDWLVLDIWQTDEAELPWKTLQVCDPARLTTYVCVKEPNRRWEFQLLPGETREEMLRPETIRGLLDPWLPPEHYTIRRAAVYQFHAATAERWREGRVLLAGDAAHQTPPFLGQGLNAGLRDAANLAWKLPLVLSGAASEDLLDTYAVERDPHARDLVEWAVAVGQLMEGLADREAGRPERAPMDQQSGYGQGRTVPSLHAGVLIEEQGLDAGPAGHVFAQPRLRDAAGTRFLLDERLGRGFAVVGRTAEDLRVSDAGQAVLDELEIPCVSLEGCEVEQGVLDHLFEKHPAVVVRPDRYVFGVVDDSRSLDGLLESLRAKLRLVPQST